MLIILIRAILLYALMILSMRLMGKRQIGELQPGELAVTMMISNMAVLPIEDVNIPMLVGAVPILTLVCFEIALSNFGMKNKRFRKLLSGNPVVVIQNGEIQQKALHKLRFTLDDLSEALRGSDIFDISEVAYAVVETNGSLSVMKKFGAETVTADMIGLAGSTPPVPLAVISDGRVILENVKKLGLTPDWVASYLKQQNLAASEVFLMTADVKGRVYLVKKESGR